MLRHAKSRHAIVSHVIEQNRFTSENRACLQILGKVPFFFQDCSQLVECRLNELIEIGEKGKKEEKSKQTISIVQYHIQGLCTTQWLPRFL